MAGAPQPYRLTTLPNRSFAQDTIQALNGVGTYLVGPITAAETLDYVDMICLAQRLQNWALNESKISANRCTDLLLCAVDYERIALTVGPLWKASDQRHPLPATIALARQNISNQSSADNKD
jgi:hypothetical protein